MKQFYTFWLFLRTLLFYCGYILLTIAFTVPGISLFRFAPLNLRARFLITWNYLILKWLRVSCGTGYRVIGEIPEGNYVVMSKHQSQWETYYLQHAFYPISIVLKQELLNVPFFGWALRLVDPIAIDRGNPKAALRKIMDEGTNRLKSGRRVLIFPEGTRTPPGKKGNYARSGANMAIAAGVPIVPVSLNAGEYWPAHRFIKYPGTITVVIGKPIPTTGMDSRTLTKHVEEWIESELEKM